MTLSWAFIFRLNKRIEKMVRLVTSSEFQSLMVAGIKEFAYALIRMPGISAKVFKCLWFRTEGSSLIWGKISNI